MSLDRIEPERWTRLLGLLDPVHEQAMATARRLAHTSDEGDDLYQDAVLLAVRKLGSLRDEGSFRSWFFAILLSQHRTRARPAQVRPSAGGEVAISRGFPLVAKDDHETLEKASFLYDSLYASLERRLGGARS